MSTLKTNRIENLTTTDGGISINNSGQVGVGTTSPAEPLEVVAASSVIKSRSSGNYTGKLIVDSNRAASAIGGQVIGLWNGNQVSRIDFVNGADGTNKDDGEIVFRTSASGSSPAERIRVLASGGITFNGDTAAANALDDYEEGTWTPAYIGSTSDPTVTYTVQNGTYTKIGNTVHVSVRLVVNTKSGGSGALRIGGLPYTVADPGGGNDLNGSACVGYGTGWNTNKAPSSGGFVKNTTRIHLYRISSTNYVGILTGDISAGTDMQISGSYTV